MPGGDRVSRLRGRMDRRTARRAPRMTAAEKHAKEVRERQERDRAERQAEKEAKRQEAERQEAARVAREAKKDEMMARQRERDADAREALQNKYAFAHERRLPRPARARLLPRHIEAAVTDDRATIEAWVHDVTYNVDDTDLDGRTALMWACRSGSEAVTELLLNSEAQLNCACDEDWTALQLACANGHEGCVRLLLAAVREGGGKLRLDQPRGPERWVAVVDAARYGFKRIVHILLEAECDMDFVSGGKRARDWAGLY